MLQFEAETFVDGLLGIGAAGGGSKEADELSDRLSSLRRDRDSQKKSRTTTSSSGDSRTGMKKTGLGVPTLPGVEPFKLDPIAVLPDGGEEEGFAGGSRPYQKLDSKKNKNKKKKKKKKR